MQLIIYILFTGSWLSQKAFIPDFKSLVLGHSKYCYSSGCVAYLC